MKTAISIADSVFEAADELARRLGISRSALYTEAVAKYVARHRDADVTHRPGRDLYRSAGSGRADAECSSEDVTAGRRGVVMKRGEIWWASLPPAHGSGPGYRRPVLVVQSDAFQCQPHSDSCGRCDHFQSASGRSPGERTTPSQGERPCQRFGAECLPAHYH